MVDQQMVLQAAQETPEWHLWIQWGLGALGTIIVPTVLWWLSRGK